MDLLIKRLFVLILLLSPQAWAKNKSIECPSSFVTFWKEFQKAVEKDRLKDLIFLSQFPITLSSANGKETQEWGPKAFQNNIYKIFSEKCDIMENKNQKEWFLKYKELPTKSSFLTCTKKWVQFCNFDFNLVKNQWKLTKINTTQKALFK